MCHLLKICIFNVIKTSTFISKTDDQGHDEYITQLINESKNIYMYFETYLDHATIIKYLSAINYLIDMNDDTHSPIDLPRDALDTTNDILTTFSLLT